MICGLRISFCCAETVAWFNGSPVRFHRPGGDDSSSSGKDPNDPSDEGLLLLFYLSIGSDL